MSEPAGKVSHETPDTPEATVNFDLVPAFECYTDEQAKRRAQIDIPRKAKPSVGRYERVWSHVDLIQIINRAEETTNGFSH